MEDLTNENRIIAEYMEYPDLGTQGDFSYLKYHTEWNWLMPVAEKCLTTDEPSDGQHYFINDALLTCNIEVVYEAVVKFIKEYNK
mgnify:FL=1